MVIKIPLDVAILRQQAYLTGAQLYCLAPSVKSEISRKIKFIIRGPGGFTVGTKLRLRRSKAKRDPSSTVLL